jgi:hypothetical protein
MGLFKDRRGAGKTVEVSAKTPLKAPPGSGATRKGPLTAPPSGTTSQQSSHKPFDGRGASAATKSKTTTAKPMPGAPVSSGAHTQGNPGYNEARS